MLFDVGEGYGKGVGMPLRKGSRKAYVMRPLELRWKDTVRRPSYDQALIAESQEEKDHTFNNYKVRISYSMKMFSLLLAQLALIFFSCLLFVQVKEIKPFLKDNPTLWVIVGYVGAGIYGALVLLKWLRTTPPLNIILITLFVLCLAFVIASLTALYNLRYIFYGFSLEVALTLFTIMLIIMAPCDPGGCAMLFTIVCTGLVTVVLVGIMVQVVMGAVTVAEVFLMGYAVVFLPVYLGLVTQRLLSDTVVEVKRWDFIEGNIHLWVDIVLMLYYVPRWIIREYRAWKRRRKMTQAEALETELKEPPRPSKRRSSKKKRKSKKKGKKRKGEESTRKTRAKSEEAGKSEKPDAGQTRTTAWMELEQTSGWPKTDTFRRAHPTAPAEELEPIAEESSSSESSYSSDSSELNKRSHLLVRVRKRE